jgi:hypothetical protein
MKLKPNKMRKFKLLALALVIGTASIFATNVEDLKKPTKELRNEIVKILQEANLDLDSEASVIIKFTFNSEGEMVVLCPGCTNKKLVSFIRENLNYKKFENPGERDKIYKMPLRIEAS